MDWTLVGVTIFGVFVGIIGWFISRQVDSVKESIKLLFTKKDALEKELNDFRIHVAGNHYEARTIDSKFEKLETTFKDGVREIKDEQREISSSITELTKAIMRHISDEQTGKHSSFNGRDQ